ncbi:MAG TPA: SDR family oxidoreductase [Candidatus Aminicenantes bacterium]|nr:SDR family oxidoreductase [Candidatus Aminicenantes bacterium]HRY66253.1 SDR family oxidoreductase [Candidatus Aminicenantes bacterium]HRZ73167.1 SDR family oxidoreductase [Candidatus Aminicenantes bacterium]
MARYLVTGGAGFIGSHIAEALVARGDEVRVLDDLSTGKMENLAGIAAKIEFIRGDIRDLETCRKAVRDVRTVFHEAALASVVRSVADPLLNDAINVRGTLNMLVAAREAGVSGFVLASSSAVYGDDPAARKVEGREGKPLSPYGVSKRVGEEYGRVFHALHGLKAVALRYFNVYGPRQDPRSEYSAVIPLFIDRLLRGERPTIFGDGGQSRDFVYVGDVVRANLAAADAEAAAGEACNVGGGAGTTVNALFAAVKAVLGSRLEADYAPPRPGDILHSTADISKAARLMGYAPAVPFAAGLEETAAWYRNGQRS